MGGQALYSALLVFHLLPQVFSNRELRNHWAPLLGKTPRSITPGQMTYHLRRLRLDSLIARIPKSHRYRITDDGWRMILFCSRPIVGVQAGFSAVISDVFHRGLV